MRADARRNRAHVLEVAIAAFAAEGLSVPVHEIARRAGVGTGTVSRHFPTKEALFKAVVLRRVEVIVNRANELSATEAPGDAFFAFFAFVAEQGLLDRGLADALVGAGFDIYAAAAGAEQDHLTAWRDLLTRAQQAGAVRADVDIADVKALLDSCLTRQRDKPDPAAHARMINIVCQGLKA
ncbi:TetR/AcrR family transcriptional regulator [Actinophytocola xanthii]|uniref:TetR family transcriptional regulator n=1 Tax=Actinophytocola xanthii TaxID=1912961 RepID=A0A1Q8CKC8_9PSEU|nr:TetR/AcrR family transcriptional regulator [Actinophytocola xanthii]OLF14792.1 TetR family transcriptional regulator [Actinophytocola xanthii]